MKHHPEQLEDEIYMGNARPEELRESSWKTTRTGTKTFYSDGMPIIGGLPETKPWFIKVSEVESAIETERKADRPWSAERIRTLQRMVDKRTVFVDEEVAK